MADGPVQDAVAGALRAVDKILAGVEPFINEQADLDLVQRRLGLPKPLVEYAPRTRRRYAAAARKGQNREAALQRERVIRKSSTKNEYGLTPSQLTKINTYRIPILESGVDIGPYLEPDVIKDIVQMYGFDYFHKVLGEQYDSIQQYTQGNKGPGRERWNSRGELETEAEAKMAMKFSAVVYHVKGTDPYYYYHGTIR